MLSFPRNQGGFAWLDQDLNQPVTNKGVIWVIALFVLAFSTTVAVSLYSDKDVVTTTTQTMKIEAEPHVNADNSPRSTSFPVAAKAKSR